MNVIILTVVIAISAKQCKEMFHTRPALGLIPDSISRIGKI